MLLIYVAGPLRPKNGRTQEEHCAVAFAVAARLWEAGHVPFCPHTTTLIEAQCHADFDTYIKGDLLIVSRCDGVVLLPDWRESEGALIEESHARRLGLPVWEYPDLPPSDGPPVAERAHVGADIFADLERF
jgi:hypothetical protein